MRTSIPVTSLLSSRMAGECLKFPCFAWYQFIVSSLSHERRALFFTWWETETRLKRKHATSGFHTHPWCRGRRNLFLAFSSFIWLYQKWTPCRRVATFLIYNTYTWVPIRFSSSPSIYEPPTPTPKGLPFITIPSLYHTSYCLLQYKHPTVILWKKRSLKLICLYLVLLLWLVKTVVKPYLINTKKRKDVNLIIVCTWSFIQRNFCLLLEQHKMLFSIEIKFRILLNDAEEAAEYDARTAYTGTVQGTLGMFKLCWTYNSLWEFRLRLILWIVYWSLSLILSVP